MKSAVLATGWFAIGIAVAPVRAADCNANDVEDANDVRATVRFSAPQVLPVDGGLGFAVADLDGDADLDLIAASGPDDTVSVLFNDGDRTFVRAMALHLDHPLSVQAGDFDGDGVMDLVTANRRSNGGSLLAGDGAGWFKEPVPFRGAQDPSWVAASDLDGDGDLDLALAIPFAAVVLWNAGDGSFGEPRVLRNGSHPIHLIAGDLEGDGRPDLVTANSLPRSDGAGNVSLAMNLGGGSFGPWRHYATGEEPSAVVAADFDGEGGADLACANRRARDVSILLNHGGGVLAGAASLPCPVTPTSAAAADLNGDGNTDLIAGCANQGAGRFSVPESLGIGPHALQVAVADLDGDGDEDLSAGVDSASSVVILWNEGVSPARSRDANANGVPDECEARPFRRGDPDGSGNVDLTDPIYLLGFLFLGGEKPACAETADADNDGRMAIADAIMLLDFLFRGGQPPGAPGPFAGSCGTDPDPPGSAGDLGCEAYGGCGER